MINPLQRTTLEQEVNLRNAQSISTANVQQITAASAALAGKVLGPNFLLDPFMVRSDRAACRIGDADYPHCSPMFRAQGAKTVYVNKIPWSCQTHLNTIHLGNACAPHARPIAIGSITVFVEKKGAGRILDYITDCTFVAEGSPNVYAGPLAP